MAGCAITLQITEQSYEPDGTISLKMPCVICDDTTGATTNVPLDVRFSPDATPAQIENAIEDEIIYRANLEWPEVTIPRSRMIYFDVKRGQ